MRIMALGHVVLKVRSLERSVPFCSDVLGLKLVARATIAEQPMAFFSIAGNHHDLALVETSPEAPAAPEAAPGLAHLALKIGDSLHDLRAAQIWLEAKGIHIERTVDHRVAQSLYILDPDGNRIELYVDGDPRIWREDPSAVAHSVPFAL
jgi:catechol 2,3-dioxygenase